MAEVEGVEASSQRDIASGSRSLRSGFCGRPKASGQRKRRGQASLGLLVLETDPVERAKGEQEGKQREKRGTDPSQMPRAISKGRRDLRCGDRLLRSPMPQVRTRKRPVLASGYGSRTYSLFH